MRRSFIVAFFDEKLCAFVSIKRYLRDQMLQLKNGLPRAALITAVAVFVVPSQPVIAAEGGSGFYLLGQRGPGAAVLPPVEGVFFRCPLTFTAGMFPARSPLKSVVP
jgi:hypothetical protein